MDGDQTSFSMYKEGVYDEPNCSSRLVSHTMVVVGYGVHKGKEYWLAKNRLVIGTSFQRQVVFSFEKQVGKSYSFTRASR